MSNNASLNPADNDSLTGLLRHSFDKFMQDKNGVLPAKVIAYEPGSPPYVQVQPLIKMVGTSGETKSRAQLSKIPVVNIGAGGYFLHFNLKAGDMGLIVACDRDISLFLQYGAESPPNTYRKKDFADSFFIPIVLYNYTINAEDSENAVLQNLDGSVRLSIFPNKVKITGGLEVDTLKVTGDAEILGNMDITGRTIINGNLNTGADITAAGTITPGVPIPP